MSCCDDDGYVDCPACHGDGYFLMRDWETGEEYEEPCGNCGGNGWLVCPCEAA